MGAQSGRALTIDWNGTVIAGVKTKSVEYANELVDITSDDDAGWRTYLATPGVRGITVNVAGVMKNQVLTDDFFGTISRTLTENYPTTTGTAAGTFILQSYTKDANHDGSCDFSAVFVSSGAVTHTAGS